MKMKRKMDQNAIMKYRNSKHQVSTEEKTEDSTPAKAKQGKKDEENFINYLPKDHHTEAGFVGH
jgi:hypothetical protein